MRHTLLALDCLDAPADETMLSLVTEDDYRPLLQYEFSIH